MTLPKNEVLCYENAYTHVYWHQCYQYLHIVYKGVFVGNHFEEGGLLQLETLIGKGGRRILYDLQNFPVSTQTNVQWVVNDLFPKMKAAGLTHISVVMPEDYYGRASAAYLLGKVAEGGIVVRQFDAEAQASAWLIELHQAEAKE
jgi:hypothetical protein